MAQYVVIARFDEKTTKQLTELRMISYKAGLLNTITEWPPHITIAAYENIKLATLLEWTKNFVQKNVPLNISFSALDALPADEKYPNTSVLFASPSKSRELTNFYYAFHAHLDEYSGVIGFKYSLKCADPYPFHATIGIFKINQIQKVMEIFPKNEMSPIDGKITALEIYTYPMKLLQRFELKNKELIVL